MSIKYFVLSILILITANSYGQQKEYLLFEKAFHSISSNEIEMVVKELCDPKYKGRLAGSPEYSYCAHWVANHFSSWGLTPGGDNGFFFQNFPVHYTDVKGDGILRITGDDNVITYTVQNDYFPGIHTGQGDISKEVVYVGYGITAPEFSYDDYAGLDVKDKIVIIEPGIPCNKEHKNYQKWLGSGFSGTIQKFDNAINHGVAGVLFAELMPHPGIKHYENFLYCHVGDRVINDLLKGTDKTASSLREQIKKNQKPASFHIKGKKVELFFESQRVPLSQTQNVVGYIPGTDSSLEDSPIIVGAHLDHLGAPGVLFPGALDNASGSAIVFVTAKALVLSGLKPLRPLVFILFGAEEAGMIGSKHYIKHPLFPLQNTFCMFNLDMVGNGTEIAIGGIDTLPQVKRYFTEANDKYIKRVLHTSEYRKASGKMYTDGEIFNYNDIFAFSVGTRKKVGRTYYHSPLDRPETLTPEIMEDISKLLFIALYKMSIDKTLTSY